MDNVVRVSRNVIQHINQVRIIVIIIGSLSVAIRSFGIRNVCCEHFDGHL